MFYKKNGGASYLLLPKMIIYSHVSESVTIGETVSGLCSM